MGGVELNLCRILEQFLTRDLIAVLFSSFNAWKTMTRLLQCQTEEFLFVSRPIKDEEIEHIELLLRFRFFIQAFLTKTIHSCMAELCFAAKKKENLIYDSTTYYSKRERGDIFPTVHFHVSGPSGHVLRFLSIKSCVFVLFLFEKNLQ